MQCLYSWNVFYYCVAANIDTPRNTECSFMIPKFLPQLRQHFVSSLSVVQYHISSVLLLFFNFYVTQFQKHNLMSNC